MATATKKNEVLTVRISASVKAALRLAAVAERRSLTNMLEVAILNYCNGQNSSKPKVRTVKRSVTKSQQTGQQRK
jgi:hypothetical protein